LVVGANSNPEDSHGVGPYHFYERSISPITLILLARNFTRADRRCDPSGKTDLKVASPGRGNLACLIESG
jgi:hypothetical protein